MPESRITVCLDEPIAAIDPHIYGHFAEHLGACIYGGIWVGEESSIPNVGGIRSDVVEALRRIDPPVVRWPGGCFADDYHWRDGIGPRGDRPRRVNIWWGETIETNAFGTHEFLRFCDLIGAEPYICGNVGSGTPSELRDWVEYCNFPGDSTLAAKRRTNGAADPFGVRYWGVGNENWGCGGHFRGDEYAAQYRRFATYLRDFGETPLFLVACGASGDDTEWTHRFFEALGDYGRVHGFGTHYYCRTAGTATEYTTDEWYTLLHRALRMEPLVRQQRAIMDGYDPQRRIGLIVDEWGMWHPPVPGRHPRHLWQQNTLRDAMVAASTLDIFNRHADKVIMANIAQTVNVLQAMILTEGERMLTTPTYHVYDMYRSHQGATSLRFISETDDIRFSGPEEGKKVPNLQGSASLKDDVLTLSVTNYNVDVPLAADIVLRGAEAGKTAVSVLSASDTHAHNTFEEPARVTPSTVSLDVGGARWHHTFAPASITVFRIALS